MKTRTEYPQLSYRKNRPKEKRYILDSFRVLGVLNLKILRKRGGNGDGLKSLQAQNRSSKALFINMRSSSAKTDESEQLPIMESFDKTHFLSVAE